MDSSIQTVLSPGETIEGKGNSVFGMFSCWYNEVPYVLLVKRWDGYTGLPGGKQEKNESLQEALLRELEEEVNLIPETNTKPFCSIEFDTFVGHAFHFDLGVKTQKEMVEMSRLMTKAKDFPAKVSPFWCPLDLSKKDFGSKDFFYIFNSNGLCLGLKHQLAWLSTKISYSSVAI